MLDIFNGRAFSVTTLTAAVNEIPYVPGRIGQLGLFDTEGVPTTSVSMDFDGELLDIVQEAPRGAPGEVAKDYDRRTKDFSMYHFPAQWSVLADEVQNVRETGSETKVMMVQALVARRMQNRMTRFAMTEEHYRLGVLKGIVTLKGGSTINLFTEFGVTQSPDVYLDLANSKNGVLAEKCAEIRHAVQDALGGVPFSGIHALCGRGFMKKLKKNPEYRETFLGHSEAAMLRRNGFGTLAGSNRIVDFGDIMWEEYGAVAGSPISVADDEARLFPLGVPGLFKTYYGPANYMETVQTVGRRLYAKQERMKFDKGVEGEIQMNTVQLCTRPKVLIKALAGTAPA